MEIVLENNLKKEYGKNVKIGKGIVRMKEKKKSELKFNGKKRYIVGKDKIEIIDKGKEKEEN